MRSQYMNYGAFSDDVLLLRILLLGRCIRRKKGGTGEREKGEAPPNIVRECGQMKRILLEYMGK